DEEAAEVVRQIYTMFLDGMAKNAIARYFNDTSLICPSLYKKQKGQKYNSPCGDGSALWATCTIDGILKNECGSIGVKFKFSDELRRIAEYVEINTKTAAG
ncbi:MAG: recombinase family protein, partial [Clostridia bacterium]